MTKFLFWRFWVTRCQVIWWFDIKLNVAIFRSNCIILPNSCVLSLRDSHSKIKIIILSLFLSVVITFPSLLVSLFRLLKFIVSRTSLIGFYLSIVRFWWWSMSWTFLESSAYSNSQHYHMFVRQSHSNDRRRDRYDYCLFYLISRVWFWLR